MVKERRKERKKEKRKRKGGQLYFNLISLFPSKLFFVLKLHKSKSAEGKKRNDEEVTFPLIHIHTAQIPTKYDRRKETKKERKEREREREWEKEITKSTDRRGTSCYSRTNAIYTYTTHSPENLNPKKENSSPKNERIVGRRGEKC